MVAELVVESAQDGVIRVLVTGSWRIGTPLPAASDVARTIEETPGLRLVDLDATGVTDWDSGFVTFVRRVLHACAAADIAARRDGLPEGVQRLLALAEAVPARAAEDVSKPTGWLGSVGERSLTAADDVRDAIAFLGEATLGFGRLLTGRARFPWREFWLVVQECGPRALGIVSLVSVLVGLILAFMGAIQLKSFGAEIYVADLVALGMVRDMGPIMVGIIMAGRKGAAFAAQLGTMTVNEEVDALATMGISPMEYLVLPRMLALMLMMPLLSIYGDVLGIVGGALVGVTSLDLGVVQYFDRSIEILEIRHVVTGLLKGTVYGVVVALAGCMRGMQCGRSAEAVGTSTTSAVVLSIVGIISSCGILTVLYNAMGV